MNKGGIRKIWMVVFFWVGVVYPAELVVPADSVIDIGVEVIPGSVKIFCSEREIPPADFDVVPAGTVYFSHPPACDSIKIIFVPIDSVIPPAQSRYRMWGTGKIPRTQTAESKTTGEEVSFSTSGSLLRGLRISNTGEVNSTSSLHFRAEGDLAGDVHISALLSDEGSPIQPEGNSLELSELDKVLIQLKSPHIDASFGDVDLSFDGGDFLNFSRRIQGVEASARFGGAEFVGFGSVSRGKFWSVEFSAQEGNQGPYPLWGENGERDIVVVAGSEKVWLNGELMRRGEDNDYIIDYNLAQITFTSRHPLGAGDRIVVDFQYISRDYPQSFFGVGAKVEPAKNATFGVFSVWQADDFRHPLVELSDSLRDELAHCGDDVPESVSAPQYLQVISFNSAFEVWRFRFGGQYSISNFDRNRLSPLDDGDNYGDAVAVAGTLGVAEGVDFFSAVRTVSGRFRSPGRIVPPDFNRNWNVVSADSADDQIFQTGLSLSREGAEFSAWVGQRRWGDQLSRRLALSGTLGRQKVEFNYANSEVSRRLSGNLALDSGGERFSAAGEFFGDLFVGDAEADTGHFGLDPKIKLSGGSVVLRGGAEIFRIRRAREWGDFSRIWEAGVDVNFSRARVSYTRRFFHAVDSAAGSDQASDIASANYSGKIAGVGISARYSLSRSQSEKLQKVYTYVGPGEGDYRWDDELGEYVADPDGDYILEYRATGEFVPVIRADFSANLSAEPKWFPAGGNFTGELSFHSENRRDGVSSYYLNPEDMFTDDSLASGDFSAGARMSLLTRLPVSVVLSSSFDRSAMRNYSSGAEFSERWENSVSADGRILRGVNFTVESGVDRKRNFRPSLARWVNAVSYFGWVALSRRFGKHLTVKFSGRGEDITDRGTEPPLRARLYQSSLEPSFFLGKFGIRLMGEWAALDANQSVVPYELSGGWYVGTNWRWSATIMYRAGTKTEFSVIYRGEKKAGTQTKHTAEARVKLMF